MILYFKYVIIYKKGKFMKKVFRIALMLVLLLTSVSYLGGCSIFKQSANPTAPTTQPGTPPDNTPDDNNSPEDVTTIVNYVSLGDSIADGVSLIEYANKDEYGFVEGSYAYEFRAYLQESYDKVNAVSYAVAGQNSSQLLANLEAIGEAELTESEQQMKTNLIQADIITICIGANDILGPATDNLYDYITKSDFDMTAKLDSGITSFTANFPKILNELEELNPNAQLIFSNIYNPFKKCIGKDIDVPIKISSYPIFTVTKDKIDMAGKITEVYLNSGSLTVNGQTKTVSAGINNIIEQNIKDKNNCILLNVRQAFDNHFEQETADSLKAVVATLAYTQEIIVTEFSTDKNVIMKYVWPHVDPHPTETGHALISELLIGLFDTED